MNFDRRAHLSEWMDEPCSYEDFRACLRDLAQVNRLTFAYRPTLHWLSSLLEPGKPSVHIVDVGCGGGDMLRKVERWARARGVAVRMTGVDLNEYAARAARQMTEPESEIVWVTGDAFSLSDADGGGGPIDIVISSLFTHHLPDDEIVRFLQWMEGVAQRGWFVNDLHREAVPYYGFQALATVMRWHRFVRHDGPLSIRRAFRHDDWQRYLTEAGIALTDVSLATWRPARLCVSRVKP